MNKEQKTAAGQELRNTTVDPVSDAPTPATAAAHTDHGARHYDRTCPACAAESDTPLTSAAHYKYGLSVDFMSFVRGLERALNAERKAREDFTKTYNLMVELKTAESVKAYMRAERAEAELAALKVKHERLRELGKARVWGISGSHEALRAALEGENHG